jgi:DNA (cytosine-5)-methyltransferase 1
MGYHLHTQIVDARHYVPQHRERIFIVGFLEPLPFEFPTPGPAHAMREARLPVLGDILEDNPKDCTLSDNLWNYLQAYAKKHQAAGNGFGCDLVGPDAVARTLSARYYKDGSEILIRQKGKNPRKLSIDECRKLMGYPEGFKPAKSKTQAYKQFGNSVVVPVVESIAHQVVKTLKTYEMVDGEARKR